MPREILDKEEFLELSNSADECRIKRMGDTTKLKLRTSSYLYTIKLPSNEAEELSNQLGCPIVEI